MKFPLLVKNVTPLDFYLNVIGTSFEFTADMTNFWSGYHSWVAADSLSPQSSYLAVSGACSIGEFRNGDGQGVISLQLIAD